ncbi:hypothetical protein [Streptomyces sp. NPDC001927]
MTIATATPEDLAKLLGSGDEAASWLTALGTDQWRRLYPGDKLLATIE